MPRALAALPIALLALAGCDRQPPAPPATQLAVGPGFRITTIDWKDAEATTRIAWGLRENAGSTEVCGAIATEGPEEVAAVEPQVLATAQLVAGETVVASGLSFFARAGTVEEGTPATCRVLGVDWDADWAETPPALSIPAESFAL